MSFLTSLFTPSSNNTIPPGITEVFVLEPHFIRHFTRFYNESREFSALVNDGIYSSIKHHLVPEIPGDISNYIFKVMVFDAAPGKTVRLYLRKYITQSDDVTLIDGIIQHPDGSTNRVHIKQNKHSADHSQKDAEAYVQMYQHEQARSRDSGGREMIAKPFMILKFADDDFFTFVTNALDGTLVDLITEASSIDKAMLLFFRAVLELTSYHKYLSTNMLPKFVNDDLVANDVLYRTDKTALLGYTFYLHNFEFITQSTRTDADHYEAVIEILYMFVTLPMYAQRSSNFTRIHQVIKEILPFINWHLFPSFADFSADIMEFVSTFAPSESNRYNRFKKIFKEHTAATKTNPLYLPNSENLQIPTLDLIMHVIIQYFRTLPPSHFETLRADFPLLSSDNSVVSIITDFKYSDFIRRRLTSELPNPYYSKYLKYLQKYNSLH
jgi:hypothetical protein